MRYLKWIFFCLISTNLKTETEDVKIKNNNKSITLTFEDKVLDNVNFHDIRIRKSGEYYIFTANITNLTADSLNIVNTEVELVDKNDNIITTLIGYFGGILNSDETKNISIKTKKDISKTKDVNFKLQE